MLFRASRHGPIPQLSRQLYTLDEKYQLAQNRILIAMDPTSTFAPFYMTSAKSSLTHQPIYLSITDKMSPSTPTHPLTQTHTHTPRPTPPQFLTPPPPRTEGRRSRPLRWRRIVQDWYTVAATSTATHAHAQPMEN